MPVRTSVAALAALALAGCAGSTSGGRQSGGEDLTPPNVLDARGTVDPVLSMSTLSTVRIAYTHHSTGGVVWDGGVDDVVQAWNARYATTYVISQFDYPNNQSGYGWKNYPWDYWNLWVAHTGASRDHGELNLDDLVASYDVIVWKHCYPGSSIDPDSGTTISQYETKTLPNYREQYELLKARMHLFPLKRFVVWTQPALLAAHTDAGEAGRAREFARWVKEDWDEAGDNIFVWDFRALEADAGGLYLPASHASAPTDDHPSAAFGRFAAPQVARRIIDVIEGRGDTGSLTGRP